LGVEREGLEVPGWEADAAGACPEGLERKGPFIEVAARPPSPFRNSPLSEETPGWPTPGVVRSGVPCSLTPWAGVEVAWSAPGEPGAGGENPTAAVAKALSAPGASGGGGVKPADANPGAAVGGRAAAGVAG
jgi:hypothetical protein